MGVFGKFVCVGGRSVKSMKSVRSAECEVGSAWEWFGLVWFGLVMDTVI